ncbi:MAG TPA: hypothetical protein VKA27_14105 [Sunxiuqinia sp.]|nr:hypothetical protein [Sunxiuqinia sp.]
MKERNLLIILLVLWTTAPVFAQSSDDFNNIIQVPLYYPEINPEHPIGIFSLDFPFYFPDAEPQKNRLSASYTMANIWHPQARMYYPQNLTPAEQQDIQDIYFGQRPDYFDAMDIKTNEKLYQSDGVLQHLRLSYQNGWTTKNNLIVNVNLYQLSGGQSWANFLVSDGFIEAFHSNFAIEDNYGRRLYPFNRASIEFDDENGNVYRKNKSNVFMTMMDAHYYRQLFHHKSNRFHFDSEVAGHLSIPLNRFHPYIIPGISTGFRTDFRMGNKSSLTFALDAGMTDETFLKAGKGIHAIDWQYRKVARGFLGYNIMSKRKNTTVIGLLINYQDPLMRGSTLENGQSGYKSLGVRFLKEGDFWEGEPISQDFYLEKLTPAALYYYSIKTFFILGFHKNGHEFNVYCGEDLFYVNNAPDIQFSFQYRFSPFGKKKK